MHANDQGQKGFSLSSILFFWENALFKHIFLKISLFLIQDHINELLLVKNFDQSPSIYLPACWKEISGSFIRKHKNKYNCLKDKYKLRKSIEEVPEIPTALISCYFFEDIGKEASKEATWTYGKLVVGSQSSTYLYRWYLFYYEGD